jgi:hypothetical protein
MMCGREGDYFLARANMDGELGILIKGDIFAQDIMQPQSF